MRLAAEILIYFAAILVAVGCVLAVVAAVSFSHEPHRRVRS